MPPLPLLDERAQEIFKHIVETYLNCGQPVGSRNLSRMLSEGLSPASVRNVMSDLEQLGLIYSPHTSAGRVPTQTGLRFFVDTYLEVGVMNQQEQQTIETQLSLHPSKPQTIESLLTHASTMLSGLSQGAGIVMVPKSDMRLKHIEFIRLEPTRALVVLVSEDGAVENRLVEIDAGMPQTILTQAGNYLNAHLRGYTLHEARLQLSLLSEALQNELDSLTQTLIDQGIAIWSEASQSQPKTLIVRGRSNLINEGNSQAELERLRLLLDDLETKRDVIELLGQADAGEGVRIFIGSENALFSLSGSSLVVAPYRNKQSGVVGALGIIGPTRLNYGRIVPMVNYTAKLVSHLIMERGLNE